MHILSKKENSITVAGVKLTTKDFPVLYQWAKKNPEWLAETLRKEAENRGVQPASVAAVLESDLAHDLAR